VRALSACDSTTVGSQQKSPAPKWSVRRADKRLVEAGIIVPILPAKTTWNVLDGYFENTIARATKRTPNTVATFSLAAVAVRFRAYIAGKQLEQQLDVARRVQQDLLPPASQTGQSFRMAAVCLPAEHVGGDFYDTFHVNHEDSAFILGDVSGKGIPAALLMGVIHGAVRSSRWSECPEQHVEATRQVNRLLYEHASGERFASMFWSYFDSRTELLHYINAGHCSPMEAVEVWQE